MYFPRIFAGLFLLAAIGLAVPGVVAAQDAVAAPAAAPAAISVEAPTSGATSGVTVQYNAVTGPGGVKVIGPDGKPISMPVRPGHPRPGGPPDGKSRPDGEKGKPDDKKDADKKPGDEKEKPDDKKDKPDEPKSIQRPSDPPKSGDPNELKLRPDENRMVRFNFTGQKWPAVMQWLADISGMTLDWQEMPGDYLNLTTQRSYKVQQARDLINRHLLARGFTMLRHDELLTVVKIEKLNPSMVPRVTPQQLDDRDPHEFVKVSFPLESLLAESAAKEFEPMLSSNGKLRPLKASNRLEAMDTVTNLLQIRELIEQEQEPAAQHDFRVFKLNYSRAEDVRKLLSELLGTGSPSAPGGGKSPSRGMSPEQMKQMQEAQMKAMAAMQKAQQAGKKPPQMPGMGTQAKVYLVVNRRENSLLVYAPPDKMALIEKAINAIDLPADHSGAAARQKERIQVYRLENLDPASVIKTLEDSGDLDYDTRLEADEANNAIIANASVGDQLLIMTLIGKLEGGGRGPQVVQLTQLRAAAVAQTIDFMMGGGKKEEESKDDSRSRRSYFSPFFGYDGGSSRSRNRSEDYADKFRVDADVKNNRLLLWCDQFELAKVEMLLEHLRLMPGEVRDPGEPKVYHLVSLDPEPFVKALVDMETLDFGSRLEVDEENNAIIAFASEADHQRISDLIGKLDGSSREFHMFPLRRLAADSVAGTIEFMMIGKEEKQSSSGYSRTYYYTDIYGGSSSRAKEKKPDEFRVSADVEYNRLLLWANDVELEEVKKLLIKLGELPPEDGNPSTMRVLDMAPGPDQQQLLDRIRRIWPSLAPNPLVVPEPEELEEQPQKPDEKESDKSDKKENEKEPAHKTTSPQVPKTDKPDSDPPRITRRGPERSVFQLALLQQDLPPETPAKTPPQPTPSDPSDAQSDPTPSEPETPPAEAVPEPPAEAVPEPPAEAVPEPTAKAVPEPTAKAVPEPTAKAVPEPTAATATAEGGSQPPAPVSITQGPDGRLIITSQDTKALDQMEDLLRRLAPPRKDYKVFYLEYAEAYYVHWNLRDFFKEEGGKDDSSSAWMAGWYGYPYSSGGGSSTGRQLGRRRPLKFIYDDDTNSILVQGANPGQLHTIQELIDLYDQPALADKGAARKTQIFQIRYSQARVISETVKDVYRDLLSSRDKALAKQQQDKQRPESRFTYFYGGGGGGGGDDSLEKRPKFQGLLSIGVDEYSNTLAVSAPESLFRDVSKMILDLDEAAKPVADVRVVKLAPGVTAEGVQQALSDVLGEGTTGKRPSKPASPKPPPGGSGQPGRPRPNGN